jgi:hypothetical protein
MSGPSPAQAAQRNYLQAVHAEVAEKGVGMLYIGAAIKNSAFHAEMEKAGRGLRSRVCLARPPACLPP